VIGASEAYGPLVEAFHRGAFLEEIDGISEAQKQRHDIAKYAAIALGYLGDSRAVAPLTSRLGRADRLMDRYIIYALAQIQDVRAIKAIVEFASDRGMLDTYVHQGLQHIARTDFEINVERTPDGVFCTISEFPELGRMDASVVHAQLWQHWLKGAGDEYARKQFSTLYPELKKAISEQPGNEVVHNYIQRQMLKSGAPLLPYLTEKIEAGDSAPIAAALRLTERKAQGLKARERLQRTRATDRAAYLRWWKANREKWVIFDNEEAEAREPEGDN
jgi:hypothetical protein